MPANNQDKPSVLVSRCLLGIPCRFHGKTHVRGMRIGRPGLIARLRKTCNLVDVCPEVDAGLSIPRPPTRIVDGRWICDGEDVTADFRRGAEIALALAKQHGCKKAYLLKDSPACDRDKGAAGKLLTKSGITVIRS